MKPFDDVITAYLNQPPCTCRANGCDEYHLNCKCGCVRGRAGCENIAECLAIIASAKRSETWS